MQKTYTVDFMTKKKVINNGIVPQYYVENNHEAIISKEIFQLVQAEIERRAALCRNTETEKKKTCGKYSEYVLTGILVCEECGQEYRRVTWARNGKKKIVWRCNNRLKNGIKSCKKSGTLEERALHSAIMKAIGEATRNKEYVGDVQGNISCQFENYGQKNEVEVFMEENSSQQTEFDNYLVKGLIEKIRVVCAKKLIIHFKSGITVEQQVELIEK